MFPASAGDPPLHLNLAPLATRLPPPNTLTRIHEQVPFRPIGPPKKGGPGTGTRTFCGRPQGAVGEFAWQPRPDGAPGKRAAGGSSGDQAAAGGDAAAAAAAAAGEEPAARAPFRPAGLPKKGRQATLQRFPEYIADPLERSADASAAARAAAREALAGRPNGGGWRPGGGGPKSGATRSIVRMNLK